MNMRIRWVDSLTNTDWDDSMTTGPIAIHLIRHGEVHNPRQILYGRLPGFPLSDRGRRQAGAAGLWLKGRPICAVFCSPMLRARQTAKEIIQHHNKLKLRTSTLLNEVCTSYEGRAGAEIDALGGDIYTGTDACYEQPEDVVARTRKFILRMRRHYSPGEVAAVTHGDVVTFMVLWANDVDLTPRNKTRLLQVGFPTAYPAHASITTLTYRTSDPCEKPTLRAIPPWGI
jgi:broad specificity phosphatase PhoE